MEVLYYSRAITDKSGKKREILIPSPELLQYQRALIPFLDTMPIHARACAYVKGGSPQLHASYHQGQQWVLSLDLRNFFGSFKAATLHNYLLGQGIDEASVMDIVRHCTYRGRIPQGAATSPVISNLLFYRADNHLAEVAERWGLVYSRYSDDLAFSSHTREIPNFPGIQMVAHLIRIKLETEGFKLNNAKVHINPPSLCGVPLTYTPGPAHQG